MSEKNEIQKIITDCGGPTKFANALGVIVIPIRTISDWNRGLAQPPPWVARLLHAKVALQIEARKNEEKS